MVATPHFKSFERQTEQLRAIAHPVRLAILNLLHRQAPLTVTNIHEALSIEQATASHHLKILRQAGILRPRRDGRYAYYELTSDAFGEILELLENS
ncbi:MAG: metalloregulator ArsR/SmtB family transcription factor [Phaeodactylibacter sp.]|uniref:ArsR/SmtB family transcription factor n=1 Tax=Phaeodactylibacter TaxID=1564515 RepID=UPI0024A9CE14|nr:metalloregulator ArsR/SmtB family transcription factor [Phaeodactylibacter xiamenensis]